MQSQEFSKEDDEVFERLARGELQRVPVDEWPTLQILWRQIHRAHPTTRRRLLSLCLELCEAWQYVLPAPVVKLLQAELGAGTRPQARVRDLTRMRTAAVYLARNPECSLSELAEGAGMTAKNKTTIRQYFRRPEFWQICNNETSKTGTGAEIRKLRKRYDPRLKEDLKKSLIQKWREKLVREKSVHRSA